MLNTIYTYMTVTITCLDNLHHWKIISVGNVQL